MALQNNECFKVYGERRLGDQAKYHLLKSFGENVNHGFQDKKLVVRYFYVAYG